ALGAGWGVNALRRNRDLGPTLRPALPMLGCLPLLLFVLCALYHAQKAMWQRESVYRNGMGFGASMGIVALLMHSFADFNLQIPANAATYTVLCAIAVIGNNHYRERRARTQD
ncbi:MAG: hypothetical protein AAAB16_02910, partial [Pseudomonas sp.]